MYAYIIGTIEEKFTNSVVIENNGIGYNILMPSSKIAIMPEEGETVKLFTYTSVREDAFELYGFTKREELNLFKKLITVNGIGPKAALSILSSLGVNQIILAIASNDSATISTAQGIGKKTAERIIIDLKDKVGSLSTVVDESKASVEAQIINSSAKMSDMENDTFEALLTLGYSSKQAKAALFKAISSMEGEYDSSDLLKAALKNV